MLANRVDGMILGSIDTRCKMKKRISTIIFIILGSLILTACSPNDIETSVEAETTTVASISTDAATEAEIAVESSTEDSLIQIVPVVETYQLTDSRFPGYPIEIAYLKEGDNPVEYIFLNAKCSSGKFMQWEDGFAAQDMADFSLIRDEVFPFYWVPEEGVTDVCDIVFTVYYSDLAVPIEVITLQIKLDGENNYTFIKP